MSISGILCFLIPEVCDFPESDILLPEYEIIVTHRIDDCERVEVDAPFSEFPAAFLKAFLNADSDALKCCAGFADELDQPFDCTAICEKVVDDEDVILRPEKFFRDEDIVYFFMRERRDLRCIDTSVQIDAL